MLNVMLYYCFGALLVFLLTPQSTKTPVLEPRHKSYWNRDTVGLEAAEHSNWVIIAVTSSVMSLVACGQGKAVRKKRERLWVP